jgi:dipeptidyl aminopeptidase/acylaminoacyl peptidase
VLPGESKSPFTLLAFIERDLTSGAEREIARGNPLGWPQPSPDGQYIATARNNPSTKTRAIVVIPAAGDEPREVLRVPLSADFVAGRDTTNHAAPMAWAGDSRSLLARTTSGKDKPVQLWWVPIDGRTAPKVIVEEWRGGPIRLHPDGRQLVFHVTLPAARQPQQIWVLENAIK